ncbi:MAG TPA: hypothetical protein VM307_06930, partial [Egibacteraceae bacterium]|nr:hypothetical protein [Egibacteraceae bacterium]
PFVPVTENCLPADQLDPDTPVSSDDPPVCTDPANDVVGRILVEEPGDGNKAALTITGGTQILEEFGGGYEPGDFARLREGARVQAWVSGPVAESFPLQATADAVLVRGE